MTPEQIRNENLTRWNRAGLERFRYVDGNAVTFLEDIRQSLAAAFPAWDKVNVAIPAGETPPERQRRILDQYRGPRREWAWEIARAFARATHILTEHTDAFANEGYLLTATQWEYLRRLVAMLDYRPRPPASASTTLALIAKTDKAPGTVKAGFQLKYAPQNGDPPVIFETLDDLDVDPRLNAVRLHGWNHNPDSFDPFASGHIWPLPDDAKVNAGQPAILREGGYAHAVRVKQISDDRAWLELAGSGAHEYIRGDTTLLLAPDKVYLPRLNGAGVLKLRDPHTFVAGQIIGWKQEDTVGFTRVTAADATSIRIAGTVPSTQGTGAARTPTDLTKNVVRLYATGETTQSQFAANSGEWRFPLDSIMPKSAAFRIAYVDDGNIIQPDLKSKDALSIVKENGKNAYKTLANIAAADSLRFFDPGHDQPVTQTAEKPAATLLEFDGGPGALKSGDRMVAESANGVRQVVHIERITKHEDSFSLTLAHAPDGLHNIARLHGPFTLKVRPVGHDRNPTRAEPGNLKLEFARDTAPGGLTAGKALVIEPEDAASEAEPFAATILDIVERTETGVSRLVLDAPAERWANYTLGNLIIRANAVLAGHGETKPATTLGSGDATQTSQSFTFKKESVAFRADPTLASGVRAAITITVGERHYKEVSTLADSAAADAHYTVQMTEEGYLSIAFGDGFHGRRLPTGRNNIAIAYRIGTGRAGNNLPPGSLTKPVRPHTLIDEVRQPVITAGGQEMEDTAQIRKNAPAHLRALDRGVSLGDCEYLAASQPGVWHAKAFLNPAGANRRECVEITVVPADGAPLGDLRQTLAQRLTNLGPPGLDFKIARFDPVLLPVRITLRVDTGAFDYASVEAAVRDAVYGAFTLQVRAPGRPVFRAELYEIIEAVTGVVNSDVSLFPDQTDPITSENDNPLRRVSRGALGEVRAVWPTERQAIYIGEAAAIAIIREEVIL